MPRYRKIPTAIRSERDLERALLDMGLKNVEVHADPVPLDDWIGRPTEVRANVIVRRKDLGASADDMGFARNVQGTLDLIVSEIHLFRFDRKWLENLAQRTGTELPATGMIQFAAGTIGAPATRTPLLTPLSHPTSTPPSARGSSGAGGAGATGGASASPRAGANDGSGSSKGAAFGGKPATSGATGSNVNSGTFSSKSAESSAGGGLRSKSSSPAGADAHTGGAPGSAARARSESAPPAVPPTLRQDTHSKPSSGGGAMTERSTPAMPSAVSTTGVDIPASQRARAETTLLLQDLGKTQKLGRAGCMLYFLPSAIWLLITIATRSRPSIGILLGIMIPWTFFFLVVSGILLAARFQRRVAEFKRRLPPESELRQEAINHLKSVARDTSNAASQTATRVLHTLEAKATAAITRLPPK